MEEDMEMEFTLTRSENASKKHNTKSGKRSLDEEIVALAFSSTQTSLSQSQTLNNNEELITILSNLKRQELINLFEKRCEDPHGDPLEFIKAVFIGSPVETAMEKRITLLMAVIFQLEKGILVGKKADEVISFLIPELEWFEGILLVDLVRNIIEENNPSSTIEGKMWEFLPKCLEIISKIETLPETKEEEGVNISGDFFKDQTLERICELQWAPSSIATMIGVLRDISFNSDQLKRITLKIIDELASSPVDKLPLIVYQFLLFSTKGHKDIILKGIINHINTLDQHPSKRKQLSEKQWRQLIGSLILQIDFSVKQDQGLGKELLKLVKNEISPWSPFTLGLLLSVGRIQRFEEPIFSFLKSSILANFRQTTKAGEVSLLESLLQSTSSISAEKIVLSTVQYSAEGWDNVTQTLVQFGILLMESSLKFESGASSHKSIALGRSLLVETFKLHPTVRAELLEQILSRILTKSEHAPNFILLLDNLIAQHNQFIQEFSQKIKEALDYLAFLTPSTAELLLKAIQPLLQVNPSFQDHIILVLRKAIFNKETDARLTAVTGFLLLLKTISQSNQSDKEKVGLEILGFLKRCLNQQAVVREHLYEGLSDIIENYQLTYNLIDAICDILYSQFLKFSTIIPIQTSPSRVEPPLRLELCVDKESGEIVEPFHRLSHAIITCCVSYQLKTLEDPNEQNCASKLYKRMSEFFLALMNKFEPEDYKLDPSSDFSLETPQGLFNHAASTILIGVFESLMELTIFLYSDISNESIENLNSSFTYSQTLRNIVKNWKDSKNSKGKKSNNTSSKSKLGMKVAKKEKPILSLKFILQSLKEICELPDKPQITNSVTLNLIIFILQTCLIQLKNLFQSDSTLEQKYGFCCKLSPLLCLLFSQRSDNSPEIPIFITSILECMEEIVKFLCSNCSLEQIAHAVDFLLPLDKSSNSVREKINLTTKGFERLVQLSIEDLPSIEIVLEIISHLLPLVDRADIEEHVMWLEELCKTKLTHPTVAKTLINLYLNIEKSSAHSVVSYRIIQDLRQFYEKGQPSVYHIINEKTASGIACVIVSFLEKWMNEIELVFTFLKSSVEKELRRDICDTIYGNLDNIIGLMVILIEAYISGTPTELIIKALTKLYKLLTLAAKDLINHSQHPSKKFQTMVTNSGATLSPAVSDYLVSLEDVDVVAEKATKSKITKESKSHPNLVFAMEKYEVILIKLSKQSEIDLTRKFKRGVARDFDIKDRDTASNKPITGQKKKRENEGKEDDLPTKKKVKSNPSTKKSSSTKKSKNSSSKKKSIVKSEPEEPLKNNKKKESN